jgi:hypothetical protein
MWQTGQHPAKDPHTYIPRRQPHGSKTLGEGQRPTPRLSIDGVWGSQTGEVAVVGGLVESFSLGGRRSGCAKLGVGGPGDMCCGFECLGDSLIVEIALRCVGERLGKRALPPSLLVPSRERLRHGKYGSANHTHAWRCNICLDFDGLLSSPSIKRLRLSLVHSLRQQAHPPVPVPANSKSFGAPIQWPTTNSHHSM